MLAFNHRSENQLIAGQYDGERTDLRVVDTIDGSRFAMDVSGTTLALLWKPVESRATRFRLGRLSLEGMWNTWEVEDIDIFGFENITAATQIGEDFDLIIREGHTPHIIFRDISRRALIHLWRASPEADWTVTEVDRGRQRLSHECPSQTRQSIGRGIGYEVDLVATPEGVAAAYYDGDCGDLRLATFHDKQWNIEIVDQGRAMHQNTDDPDAITGRFPSLALDPQGKLAVAYHNSSQGTLHFARRRGGSFLIETVDLGVELDANAQSKKHLVGSFASLNFDENERPTILYFDATDTALKIAWRSPTSETNPWRNRKLLREGIVGLFSTQAVSSSFGRYIALSEKVVPSQLNPRSELVWLESTEPLWRDNSLAP